MDRGPAPKKTRDSGLRRNDKKVGSRVRGNDGSGGDIGTAMQFGISIILFTLIGSWLDKRFNTSPALLFAGMAVGAAAGFYSMYTKLTAHEKQAGKKGSDTGSSVNDDPNHNDRPDGKGGKS